jgi:hypothetical protein
MDLLYAVMAPEDGFFFHRNVMHRFDQNRSPDRGWTVFFAPTRPTTVSKKRRPAPETTRWTK